MDLAVGQREEEDLGVGRPLDLAELRVLQVAAPQSVAVDAADDDGAVLVDDADLLAVAVPRHARHDRLVPVVDHLLVPVTCAVTGTAHISIDFQF